MRYIIFPIKQIIIKKVDAGKEEATQIAIPVSIEFDNWSSWYVHEQFHSRCDDNTISTKENEKHLLGGSSRI